MNIKLRDFDHFKDNPIVHFKKEECGGIPFVIISYMIACNKFWQEPLALETRGITFREDTGECVSRPFEKFFNVNETELTQSNLLNWENAIITEKLDGSLITPVPLDNGSIRFKTKKSMYSDIANYVNDIFHFATNEYRMSQDLTSVRLTPIFEFTSPATRIVINYPKPELTLIAVRDNDDGSYVDFTMVRALGDEWGVNVVNSYKMDRDNVIQFLKSSKEKEGFVLTQANGLRVKFKSEWYLALHRISTVVSYRNIAEAVVNETIDDMKSEAVIHGLDISIINDIENQVISEFDEIARETKKLYNKLKACDSRKEIANLYSQEPYFPLAMQMYDGKEPSYTRYWKNNFLKNYSTRCAFNKNF